MVQFWSRCRSGSTERLLILLSPWLASNDQSLFLSGRLPNWLHLCLRDLQLSGDCHRDHRELLPFVRENYRKKETGRLIVNRGFDCVASSAGQQLQYPWWSTYSCTEAASGFTIPPTPLVVYSSGTPVETQTRTTNGGVNAYSIQVRYQSTDFRAITSPTSTSTSVTTSLTPTSSIISTSNGQSSSLSTGAQAGIGVAVGLAGLVLIVIGAFFLLRRLRLQRAIKNRKPDTVESRYGGVQSGKTELDATRAVQTMHYSEIDSNKDGTPWGQSTVPQELSAQPSVHELGTARSMRR